MQFGDIQPVFEFGAAANLGIGALSQQMEKAFDDTLSKIRLTLEDFCKNEIIDDSKFPDNLFYGTLVSELNEFETYVSRRKNVLHFWQGWCLAGFIPAFSLILATSLMRELDINGIVGWGCLITLVIISVGPFLAYFSAYFLAFLKGLRFYGQLQSIEQKMFNYLTEKRRAIKSGEI